MKIMTNVMVIPLTTQEVRTKLDRLQHAENLIKQLKPTHQGRNNWLIKYGQSVEAKKLRKDEENK